MRPYPGSVGIIASLLLLGGCSEQGSRAADGGVVGGSGALAQPQLIRVDAQRSSSMIRSLQGAHWDPGAPGSPSSATYARLGIDMIRTHDAGGIDGSGAGDIDGPGAARLFPTWDADPTLPASYNFAPTDALIENIRATGAEVFFRVGRSNIGGLSGGGNAVPSDYEKYAEVVRHVVMHYNKGWASGFEHGIRYFEIWNEPDFLPFWAGTPQQFHELYAQLSLAVKAADDTALVGGPANMSFNDYTGMRASFMQFVRERGLPLDFYSYHKYTNHTNDPLDYARMARAFRAELDSMGLSSTRIVNSEYGTSLTGDPVIGGDAGRAAFAAQALIFMQDAPVDLAMSYMPVAATPSQENLGFAAVSMLGATRTRLWTEVEGNDAYAALAGMADEAREIRVVIAGYRVSPLLVGPLPSGNDELIDIPGLGPLTTVTYLDRRSPAYRDTDGYRLVVENIPEAWGEIDVESYRVDAENDLAAVGAPRVERTSGSVTVYGRWAPSPPAPPEDPGGVAQGVDVVVLRAR